MTLCASSALHTVLSVLLAVAILLAMVTVHEFGHYCAGKLLKFKIDEFAVGMGPALFKHKRKNGETVSLRALPLGGFCAFAGEDGLQEEKQEPFEELTPPEKSEETNTFTSHPAWQRILVLVAGPLMNYLLALVLILVCFGACGQTTYQVKDVVSTSEYALQADDAVVSVNGKGMYLMTDYVKALNGQKQGDVVPVLVYRGGRLVECSVALQTDCAFTGEGDNSRVWRALGVGTIEKQVDGETGSYFNLTTCNVRYGFWRTIGRSFVYSFKIAGTIFQVLGQLLTGRADLSTMGGPVTTIKVTSEVASRSFQSFLEISAYIGVNLAVFNLLPIPALDGSKIVFCLIEWIFRKPVPRKIEAIIHTVGIVCILAFAVLVDILQFVTC